MKFSKIIILSLSSVLSLAPVMANATNGAFMIGFGAHSRAMGGTGVADNRGGMAAAFNPATMIDSGSRFDIGGDIFVPPRSVTHNSGVLGFTDEKSSRNVFLVPAMGGTYKINNDLAVGFAFIGAGLKTQYNQSVNSDSCQRVNAGQIPGFSSCPPTFYDPNITTKPSARVGVELIQMQIDPSIAYRVDKHNTFGVSFIIGAQYFRAEGLQAFGDLGFTSTSGGLTNNGFASSFGGGYRLGWLGTFMDKKLKIGLNYSSRVWMQKMAKYRNLFAEHGSFDIPENFALGLAYNVNDDWTVALDIQRIRYSAVKSIGNPGPAADAANINAGNLFPLCPPGTDPTPCLTGGPRGLGFGWTDQTVYKLGVDWKYSDRLHLRAGYNFGKSPIPNDQVLLNMLAPATPEHHITFGGGYNFTDTMVLDANVMIVPIHTIRGPTAFGPGGAPVQGSNASIAMEQFSVGATLGIKF